MLTGCEKKTAAPTKTAAAGDPNRGRAIYLSNCAACHNPDPSKDGSVGPAIKGASRELIEARLMRASYPPGYKPKSALASTAAMINPPITTRPVILPLVASPNPGRCLAPI